jgi:tetratricopeptide (TPR) repeat protein
MQYLYLIPLSIITLSLGGVLVIILRKFPQLARVDVSTIPFEREAEKKKELLEKRVEEEQREIQKKLRKGFEPVRKAWGQLQLRFRIFVGKINKLWYHEHAKNVVVPSVSLSREEREQKFDSLLQEAEEHAKNGKFDLAEGLFIAAIKLRPHSVPAYRGLADTYLARESFEEAKQTFKFLLQLSPDDDSIAGKLGEIAEVQGRLEEAIGYLQQAVVMNDSSSARFCHLAELLVKVNQPQIAKEAILSALELEPKNPKYLDLLTEIAILVPDRPLALKAYKELRLVNPNNQKLDYFKGRIHQL